MGKCSSWEQRQIGNVRHGEARDHGPKGSDTMSNDKPVPDKVDPKKETKISSADDLTKTGKSGDIELDEEELKQTTGGAVDMFIKKG